MMPDKQSAESGVNTIVEKDESLVDAGKTAVMTMIQRFCGYGFVWHLKAGTKRPVPIPSGVLW